MDDKKDELIDEIRKHREEHAESFDFDLRKIVADLQRQEEESDQETVSRPPRRPVTIPGSGSA